MIHLRDYQRQALDALAAHRAEHPDETRLLIQMATGLGKTITFAHEAVDHLESFDGAGNRVLILVHTDELTQQAAAKARLVAQAPWTVGIVKAGQDEIIADIIIGSVQTLANPARRARISGVGLIIVDEAHHAVARTYQEILRYYGATERLLHTGGRYVPVTGYTATPERGDGAALGSVWQNLVFSRETAWAVRKGYLVPPVGYTVTVPGVGQAATQGDAAVDQALVDSLAPESVVDAWQEQDGRDIARRVPSRSTVLFAPLVRSADAFRDAFRTAGITAATVHGAMPADERVRVLADYAAGRIQVLCNAMVLTEGWDAPRTKCVIWARPTRARHPLFVQGAGRGLRPWLDGPLPRDQQDCVLLVVSDETPGLASIADLSTRPIEPQDGKSLLALEDEYDLSRDLEPDAPNAYAGRVDVTAFDPLVARSSKVWQRTKGGALFVPCGTRQSERYIAVLPDAGGYAVAWVNAAGGGHRAHRNVPDLELAMSLAEDEAQERGGDFGRLIADKTRPWRAKVPSEDVKELARGMGLERELDAILSARAGGKAGKVADLINREKASRLIDPVVRKLSQAAGTVPVQQ